MCSIDKSVRRLEQGFTIVVSKMDVLSAAWPRLADKTEAREILPPLLCTTLKRALCSPGFAPIKGMSRVLACLDYSLHPDAIAGVYPQGHPGEDGLITLKIAIKRNRLDAAVVADALVSSALAPALWAVGAPYSVFIDGTQKPRGAKGWLVDNSRQEEILEERIEWVLTSVAPGWTEEVAEKWWFERERYSERPDSLGEREEEEEENWEESVEAEVPGGAGESAEGEGTGGAKGAGKGAELDNLADLGDFSDPEGEAALRDAESSGNGFPPPGSGGAGKRREPSHPAVPSTCPAQQDRGAGLRRDHGRGPARGSKERRTTCSTRLHAPSPRATLGNAFLGGYLF